MSKPKYVKIFGKYYEEPDRGKREWVSMKHRDSIPLDDKIRYLSAYLQEEHDVTIDVKAPAKIDQHSSVAEVMKGLESDTNVELLRRKVVRLANALAEVESERDSLRSKLMRMEAALSGLDNVILSDIDDSTDKEKKLALLKVVFEENKQLRKDLSSE